MVKNCLASMSCEERKKVKTEFYATDEGQVLKSRLNRLIVYSFLLVIFGVYVIIDSIAQKDTNLQLIYGIGLVIVAAVFFIGRYFIIFKKVNDFVIENSKKVTVKEEKKVEEKQPEKVVTVEKKETPVKKATPVKKTETVKKATPAKKTSTTKKVAPAKKSTAAKKPSKTTTKEK